MQKKKFDLLLSRAKALDNDKDVLSIKGVRERELEESVNTCTRFFGEKRQHVLQRMNMQDLRDAEGRARGKRLAKILKNKQKER